MCENLGIDKREIAATVPGEIHQDLFNAGVTKNPILYRFEHMNQKWVAQQQWTYKTEISGSSLNQLFSNNEQEAFLKLSTVGTISKVYLNGIKIGATDNIFRTFYFPIK